MFDSSPATIFEVRKTFSLFNITSELSPTSELSFPNSKKNSGKQFYVVNDLFFCKSQSFSEDENFYEIGSYVKCRFRKFGSEEYLIGLNLFGVFFAER